MAEAHNTLPGNRRTNHQLRLERKQIAMTATMARYLARKRVKDHLRANGVRLWRSSQRTYRRQRTPIGMQESRVDDRGQDRLEPLNLI